MARISALLLTLAMKPLVTTVTYAPTLTNAMVPADAQALKSYAQTILKSVELIVPVTERTNVIFPIRLVRPPVTMKSCAATMTSAVETANVQVQPSFVQMTKRYVEPTELATDPQSVL